MSTRVQQISGIAVNSAGYFLSQDAAMRYVQFPSSQQCAPSAGKHVHEKWPWEETFEAVGKVVDHQAPGQKMLGRGGYRGAPWLCARHCCHEGLGVQHQGSATEQAGQANHSVGSKEQMLGIAEEAATFLRSDCVDDTGRSVSAVLHPQSVL